MRPEKLYKLFASTETLKGVGPAMEKKLSKLVGPRVLDLVMHAPVNVIDRSFEAPFPALKNGDIITTTVTIMQHKIPARSYGAKVPYKVICSHETGGITLTFFNAKREFLVKLLPVGQKRVISGEVHRFQNILQMPHPDYIELPEMIAKIRGIEPVYPLTHGISNKVLSKIVRAAVSEMEALPEWQDESWIKQQKWPAWLEALKALHQPKKLDDLLPTALPRTRLAYDELLAHQLALALTRASRTRQQGVVIEQSKTLRAQLKTLLPFELTRAQVQAIAEIDADMASPHRMIRLLQGDVGSGKTMVALMTMLSAIEMGKQAAFMAPTELLARQHFATLGAYFEKLGIRAVLLTSQLKGRSREEALQAIARGEVQAIIGTHALLQEHVLYRDLQYVVIDEQHRFGVKQRMQLIQKNEHTDILMMSATPIPRTLALTFYGDMDVSQLTEKPAGRKPIATKSISLKRIEEVLEGLKRVIAEGQRIYWICPLIAASEKTDLAAVEARFHELEQLFPGLVGMVHGRVKSETREATMQKFRNGELKILVATTVIEVGVDVPEATVMVIEHAERFGLAQLHQLRGRVGRGDKASSCLLLYEEAAGETARARLNIMRETEDGFKIAEEDLRLRGAGDVLGTKQSGMPEFRFADLAVHQNLLLAARDDVKKILHDDAKLNSKRGDALKLLLHLQDYDIGEEILGAGF